MKNISKIFAICASLMMVLATSCKVDKSVSISITPDINNIVITAANPVTLRYSITSGTGSADVTVSVSENISMKHFPAADKMSGSLVLSLVSESENSYAEINANNGVNNCSRRIDLEMETVLPDGPTSAMIPAAGGNITLHVLTNVDYDVTIPESAQDWLTYVPSSKTIESKGITFNATKNEDTRRETKVTVKSKTSNLKVELKIEQAGILNNLFVTYGQREVIAPNLLGNNPSGTIFWGDDRQLKWQENAQHIYTDNKTQHIMELHTPQQDVEFTTLEGVVRISFIDM